MRKLKFVRIIPPILTFKDHNYSVSYQQCNVKVYNVLASFFALNYVPALLALLTCLCLGTSTLTSYFGSYLCLDHDKCHFQFSCYKLLQYLDFKQVGFVWHKQMYPWKDELKDNFSVSFILWDSHFKNNQRRATNYFMTDVGRFGSKKK